MRVFGLIALISALAACGTDQCPPSTVEVNGLCMHPDDQAAKSQGGAIVGASGPCEKEGEMRCVAGSEVERQRCTAGRWQDQEACPAPTVCQRTASKVGTCSVGVDRCPELTEGSYCEGSRLHLCEAGKQVSSETCGSTELCEAGRSSGVCTACVEGEFRCRGTRLESCGADASWNLDTICKAGTICDASMGVCGSGSGNGPGAAGTGAGGAPAGTSASTTNGAGAAKMCSGPESQACGKCGMQIRTCDSSTGQWSQWAECKGEGECKAGETGMCGNGGMKTCKSDCKWDTACAGQKCTGPLSQTCGLCGGQTRTCDSNTGQFTDWTTCQQPGGACAPGSTQACSAPHQVQTCTASCSWGLCTCVYGFNKCGDSCVDTRSDDDHCGPSCSKCSGEGNGNIPVKCHQSRCVECTADADCTPTGLFPRCSDINKCVMCTDNSHCINFGTGSTCTAAHVCTMGTPP